MSINTNHTQESLTPESGVLKIEGTGALKLPAGDSLDRPSINVGGYIRFATNDTTTEYFDGSNWQTLTSKEYVDNELNNITLDKLVDVQSATPTDGQVISYDANLGQFRTQTQALTVITRLFQGTGTAFDFDIITSVGSVQNLVVSVDGIQQEPFYSYTLVDGHIVNFDEAPEAGARIQVKILKSTTSTDRARPRVTGISYSTIGPYTTISIVATDITYGTGARIGNQEITRIDYPTVSIMQLMIETSQVSGSFWNTPQDLTLVDTSGNEFLFPKLISYGMSKPYWTNSNSYIGTFSAGDTINFTLGVNNATSITIDPAYAGESAIGWLSISNGHIVGTAPNNSTPSRYQITVTASNGSVNITNNFWLLVI